MVTRKFFYWPIFLLLGLNHASNQDDQSIDSERNVPLNLETITIEDYVYVLDDSNYEPFVKQHRIAMVEFYAPWCGHCKTLSPEYSKAAKIFQEDSSDGRRIVFGKIDATKYQEFSRQHDVTGFPTLFLYQNGTKQDYDGPRTAQGIVDTIRERTDPNYKPPEKAVITLTESNFDKIISTESLVLVEFFAPWCGHCKKLQPEYERAAGRLKELEKPIKLAKVDATIQKELASRFEVKGYPTLLVFRNGKQSVYRGPRDENGIVSYMKQWQKLPSILISTKEQLRKQMKEDIPTIIGLFDESDQKSTFELFIDLAYDQFDQNNHFVHIFDDQLIRQIQQKPNTLLLFLPLWYRSKYETNSQSMNLNNDLSVADIRDFIKNNSLPLVGYRNGLNYDLYADRYPIIVVYYDVDFSFDHRKQTQLIREKVLKAAVQFKTENLTFAIANENDNDHEIKELKLEESGADINVGYYKTPKKRYRMEPTDDFDTETLVDFILSVRTGKLSPVIRSQPIPQENPLKNVWTVVGDSFEKLVFNSSTNVFLEFYAPWCAHCQALEPIYEQLALYFQTTYNSIRFMKIDATANDYPDQFQIEGYPMLYYIPHHNDLDDIYQKPIQYDGERNFEALKTFLMDRLERAKGLTNTKDEL